MDDTMDQTGNEEDGDENDDKILISKSTHQVSPLHAFNKQVGIN